MAPKKCAQVDYIDADASQSQLDTMVEEVNRVRRDRVGDFDASYFDEGILSGNCIIRQVVREFLVESDSDRPIQGPIVCK